MHYEIATNWKIYLACQCFFYFVINNLQNGLTDRVQIFFMVTLMTPGEVYGLSKSESVPRFKHFCKSVNVNRKIYEIFILYM